MNTKIKYTRNPYIIIQTFIVEDIQFRILIEAKLHFS